MNSNVHSIAVLVLSVLSVTGCSSTPEPQEDPYNMADEQRSRADRAQDELSSETSAE